MKFGIGDRVRVKSFREEWAHQAPRFLRTAMGNYCGTEFTIKEFSDAGYVYHEDYYWNEDWLELVIEEDEDIESSAFEEIICLHQKKKG